MEDPIISQAQELEQVGTLLGEAVTRKDLYSILAVVAEASVRIAHAQEALVEMARTDMQEEIQAAIQGRAEQLAHEIDENRGKRSFIGKRT